MAQTVTMNMVYSELKSIKREMETIRTILIQGETISKKELNDIRAARKEMESGKEKSFEDVFG